MVSEEAKSGVIGGEIKLSLRSAGDLSPAERGPLQTIQAIRSGIEGITVIGGQPILSSILRNLGIATISASRSPRSCGGHRNRNGRLAS
jgi:hypothetical protein